MITPKHVIKKKRKLRLRKTIRKKINGTPEKPRMLVVRTNKYIYTQVYDDTIGKVIASASSLEKEIKSELKSTRDTEAAKTVGKIIAERLKEAKVDTVVFDRNVYPFAGRIKAFADSARENGLKF